MSFIYGAVMVVCTFTKAPSALSKVPIGQNSFNIETLFERVGHRQCQGQGCA